MLAPTALAIAIAFNLAPAPPQSVLLRYKFRPGTSHRYEMDMAMNMSMGAQPQGFNMGLKMTMKQSVVSVEPNGTAAIKVSVLNQTTTMNGKPMGTGAQATGKEFSLHMSPTGQVSQMNMPGTGSMGAGGFDMQGMQFGTVLPDKPVQAGSHWTSTITGSTLGGTKLANTLERIYSSGGSTLAQIHSVGTVDMGKLLSKMGGTSGMNGAGLFHLDVHYTWDVTRGLALSMSSAGTYSMQMSMGQSTGQAAPMTMNGSQKMTMKLAD